MPEKRSISASFPWSRKTGLSTKDTVIAVQCKVSPSFLNRDANLFSNNEAKCASRCWAMKQLLLLKAHEEKERKQIPQLRPTNCPWETICTGGVCWYRQQGKTFCHPDSEWSFNSYPIINNNNKKYSYILIDKCMKTIHLSIAIVWKRAGGGKWILFIRLCSWGAIILLVGASQCQIC